MGDTAPSRELLGTVANAYGVATEYWAFDGTQKPVSDSTLIKVLAAMDVDASSADGARRAIRDAELDPWRHMVPECTVIRQGRETGIQIHVPHGSSVQVSVHQEDGRRVDLRQVDDFTPPRDVDGVLHGQASFIIPASLPLGYHTVCAHGERPMGGGPLSGEAPLIVVPNSIPLPSETGGRGWGVMAQLYSVRSRDSWGVGDTADLKELCSTFGEMGGQFVLINPLHAAEPLSLIHI